MITLASLLSLGLLLSLLSPSSAFDIDNGCIVKHRWGKRISWQDFRINFWVEPSMDQVLTMKALFRGLEHPWWWDKFKIHKKSYEFITCRDLMEVEQPFNTSKLIKNGWNEIFLQVKENYTLWSLNDDDKQLLMEHEIYKPIDTLTFEGSNITVNCRDPVKVWKLSDEPVVIPLDYSRNPKISLYSFEHMKPTIELGDRSYTLGIDNHSITSVHDQPLSPYKIYNISLTCDNSSRITCSIKENNITIGIDTTSSIPEYVSFGKASPGHFYIMLPDAKDKRQSNKALTPKLTGEIARTIKQGAFILFGAVCVIFAVQGIRQTVKRGLSSTRETMDNEMNAELSLLEDSADNSDDEVSNQDGEEGTGFDSTTLNTREDNL